MKVIVIGGGPAGMLAAIRAASLKHEVVVLEKMSSCGKKLLITGKGRCNITSSLEMNEFISYVPGNGKFLYSAFQAFTNQDIVRLLEKHGVKVKQERGNRIFPVSDKAQEVLQALLEEMRQKGVKIRTNVEVTELLLHAQRITGIKTKENEILYADKVILATGGKSYPTTGSTGDGYRLAKAVGHTIVPIQPSLVPFVVKQKELCQKLQGLSLKNISIKLWNEEKKKPIYEDFGEMLFTHFRSFRTSNIKCVCSFVKDKEVRGTIERR